MSYIPWTEPQAGAHPRLLFSDAHGPLSVSAMRTKCLVTYQSTYNALKNYAQATNTNGTGLLDRTPSYFYNRNAEYAACMPFCYTIQPTGVSSGLRDKIRELVNYFSGVVFSGSDTDPFRLGGMALAMLYDHGYPLLSDQQMLDSRGQLWNVVNNTLATPLAHERIWGHSSGDLYYAAAILSAILNDGTSAENSNYRAKMHEILDYLWDGDIDGTSFMAPHKYFGDTDGGSYKGCGMYCYQTQNQSFFAWMMSCLRSALGIDVHSYFPFWAKWNDWMIWHWTGDHRMGHQEHDNLGLSYYHPYHHLQALVTAQALPASDPSCQAANWLSSDIAQYRAIDSTKWSNLWGPYLIWDLLHREDRGTPTRPTLISLNGGNQMKVFRECRKVIMKAGFLDTSTSVSICAGRFTGNHYWYASGPGHFDFFTDGSLLLGKLGHNDGETTTYKIDGDPNNQGHKESYYKQANSFNICTIFDSNEISENNVESFTVQGTDSTFVGRRDTSAVNHKANVGGCIMPKSSQATFKYLPWDMADLLAQAAFNYETFAQEPVETTQYCYHIVDCVRRYYSAKVTRYRRHFLWLKSGVVRASWTRPILLIWDDMLTHSDPSSAPRTQEFQVCSYRSPTVSGQVVRVASATGQVFVKTLNPAVTNRQVISGYIDRTGTVYPPRAAGVEPYDDSAIGVYRVAIWPSVATTEPSFFHALFGCPTSWPESSVPQTAFYSAAGFVGVEFPADNLRVKLSTTTSYSVTLEPLDAPPPPPPPTGPYDSTRASVLGLFGLFGVVPPLPDSSLVPPDQQQLGGVYRDVALDETPPPPPPPPTPTPPSAPTSVAAEAGDDAVLVTWAIGPEVDLAVYHVERQGFEEGSLWIEVGTAQPTSAPFFWDTSVDNGSSYRYRVIAEDGDDELSQPSDPTPFVTPTAGVPPPDPPGETDGKPITDVDTTPGHTLRGSGISDISSGSGRIGKGIDSVDTTPTPQVTGRGIDSV